VAVTSFKGQYRFLSNFYPCKIEMDEKQYPSVEHAFQASKTYHKVVREQIRCCVSPAVAKRCGKMAPLRDDWEQVKVEVMTNLVTQKFLRHPSLGRMLLDTGDGELIEGNWWNDTFWGICKGKGENHLGKILMQTREMLRR